MDFVELSLTQRQHFDEHGYMIVPQALDAQTVARLIEVGDRFMAQAGPVDNHYANRYIDLLYDSALTQLTTCSTTVPLVLQLLSPEIRLTRANIIYKYPQPVSDQPTYPDGDGRSFRNWHRDLNNFSPNHPIRGTVCIRVGYCLTDFTEPNSGVTLLVPGSHKLTEQLRFNKDELDPPHFVEPSLRAGDAYLFSTSMYHTPAVNFTDRPAKGLLVSYAYNWWAHRHPPPDEATLECMDAIEAQLFGKEFHGPEVPLRQWGKAHGLEMDEPPMRVFV
jgi:ectoine hydroxylase-related dioxygenase (phytanoyl-CoA dioxygenase family)